MSVIKHRTIAVENIRCAGCDQAVHDALLELDGVKDAAADTEHGRIRVAYDLEQASLEDIERKLDEIGHPAGNDFVSRIQKRIFHFTEKNERDNLTAPHRPCCSDYIGDSMTDEKLRR